jgi:putative transposase
MDWRIALEVGVLPKVSGACKLELEEVVDQDPREVGKPFSVWTCLDLVKYLVEKGFELVSDEAIRRMLHRLNFRIIRPVLSINSPDEQYETKVAHLQQCQKLAREGKMILLYEDEVDLNLLPGIIGCWTRRGSQRKIRTPGQNVKRYGFGAVDFLTGRLTYRVGERKNSDGFIALIEQIVAEYCPGEVYLGPKIGLEVDNDIIHRSKKTQAVLDKYADRIEIVPLPTYSPKLNLIEMLWKYLRRKITHNHLFESIEKLVEAVLEFLKTLNDHPAEVLSVIGCSG